MVDSGTSSSSNSIAQSIITGSPTANSFVTATLSGHASTTIQLSGTASTTCTFERSIDGGTTYTPFSIEEIGIGAAVSSLSMIDNKAYLFRGNTAGLTNIRVRCTTYTSGTVLVKIQPSYGPTQIPVNQGVPAAIANAWPVKITDGTNSMPTGDSSARTIHTTIDNASLTVGSHAVTNAGTFIVQSAGTTTHDAPAASVLPVLVGGFASAAAPTSVSNDGDSVQAWYLRNGAAASVLTAAGALIGGDAANGLDVDVTRLPTLASVTTVSTVTAVTDITNWGNIVDNAQFTDGTTRLMPAAYIFDETAGTGLTENDAAAARIDSKRAQVTTLEDATTRGLRAGIVDETGASAVDALAVGGGSPHDAVNSGNPLYLGAEAIAHGTNPTAVAAADRTKLYANRAGVPFVIGGHPNTKTIRLTFTAAQTNVAIVTVAAGLKIVLTGIMVVMDNASTVFPTILIGFATATTPTTTSVVLAHGGLPAGGGINRGDGSGIIGIGADDEDLRITTTGIATGNGVDVVCTYYTIES